MTSISDPRLRHRPVTRNDVARRAGVSTAVVSYVINNGPKPVAPATAARVREAIEALGYRPNLSARALRSGSTQMLALVVSDISNPFFADYALQVQAEARVHGYAVLMANAHEDAVLESQVVDDLIDRQVDGLILASVGVTAERAKKVRRHALTTVVIDAALPVPGLTSLGSDVEGGSRAAVEHLVQHGHERVALVMGQGAPGTDLREEGWQAATRAAGLADGAIARRPFTREGGYQAALQLLRDRHPPTAIFASSDLQGVGVLRALHASGRRVPEDVAVVSFDGTTEAEFTTPPLTAAEQPVKAMAVSAVRRVLGLEDSTPDHHMFPMSLAVRESCGCPPHDLSGPNSFV